MSDPKVNHSADTARVGRVGFTGTREGMTQPQRSKVNRLLRELAPTWVHHGDCVGADDQFHELARLAGAKIMLHPPDKPDLRAFRVADDIAFEKPYLDRNRDIVNACEVIIATPKETREANRGGTWWTVRLARKLGREVVVVWPDGSTDPMEAIAAHIERRPMAKTYTTTSRADPEFQARLKERLKKDQKILKKLADS